MLYLALGAAALWAILAAGRGKMLFKYREWRFAAGALSIAAFAGAAFAALRESWWLAALLLVFGLWQATAARMSSPAAPKPASSRMSLSQARSILGVEADATPQQIQAAYKRLMKLAHPDKGGTPGLAAQLNAARDRLLEG